MSRLSPKSAILIFLFAQTRMFLAAKSRCNSDLLAKNACKNIQKMKMKMKMSFNRLNAELTIPSAICIAKLNKSALVNVSASAFSLLLSFDCMVLAGLALDFLSCGKITS